MTDLAWVVPLMIITFAGGWFLHHEIVLKQREREFDMYKDVMYRHVRRLEQDIHRLSPNDDMGVHYEA